MKKIKKLTAMLLTLVMSLALAVPCFAADKNAGDEVYTYDLGNGIIATITVQPADNVLKPYAPHIDVNRTASPTDSFRYSLYPSDGAKCDAHVMNMAPLRSGINMSVHFDVVFNNGQNFSPKSFTVTPRHTATINLVDSRGNGLDCDIFVDAAAMNADSVDFNYWHIQRD